MPTTGHRRNLPRDRVLLPCARHAERSRKVVPAL